MKLYRLRLKQALILQRERQIKLNYQLNFSQIGHKVFQKLPLKDSLYFIVFANILIKLMRKIGKMCSLILFFCHYQYFMNKPSHYFYLTKFGLKLCQCVPMA